MQTKLIIIQTNVLILSVFICSVLSNDYVLIEEETPEDSTILDIPQKLSYDCHSFYLDNKYFSVTSNGKLKVKTKIDIDSICTIDQKCCGDSECFISLSILYKVNPDTVEKALNLKVIIKDINDNAPIFQQTRQKVSVSEFTGIGKRISLSPAQDMDFDVHHRIQNYTLYEDTKTFSLDQSNVASPALIVNKNLDYEKQKRYVASWKVCDFGFKCSKQDLIIDVTDENDNTPKFSSNKLSIHISEDFQVGRVIIKLNATDLDAPPHDNIKYGFWESDKNIQQTFLVTENTGEIRLQRKLHTTVRTYYKFKVYAADSTALSMEKDFVEVELFIDDVNDHEPKIDFVNIKGSIDIKENSVPGHILSIQVSDEDLGENGNFTCSLVDNGKQDFELVLLDKRLFSLRSVKSFDYETEKVVSTVVLCRDFGTPSKSSHRAIQFNIIDVNEYQPQFLKPIYQQNIMENQGEGQYILTVDAKDRDAGAVLRYEMDENVKLFLTIDSLTGVIRSGIKKIDREVVDKFQFTVTVLDERTDPFSAKATVIIHVLDENDNTPIFVESLSSVRFFLLEDSEIHTDVMELIRATDADKSEINSKIQYFIENVYDSQLREVKNNFFTISNIGKISNLVKIDREVYQNFTLTIKAKDMGIPSLSAFLNITLFIDDVNDNGPVWVNPQITESGISMFNVSSDVPVGTLLTTVKAIDPDEGVNGVVEYSLKAEIPGIIINSTTGEIILTKRLFQGSYKMILTAQDCGSPRKFSVTELLLNIIGDEMNALNSTIIVLLLVVTGVVSLFLIIAITCVRRKPKYIPSFNQSSTDIQKSMQSSPSMIHDPSKISASTYYSSSFDMIPMSKSLDPNDIYEPNPLLTSTLLPCTQRYSKFTLAPNYITSTMTVGRATPSLRATERDDDSADSGKGGSEDDIGLANIQVAHCSNETADVGIKNNSITGAVPNNRILSFNRYNYRPRHQNPFYMVPENDIAQRSSNSVMCLDTSCKRNMDSLATDIHNYSCTDSMFNNNYLSSFHLPFRPSQLNNTLQITYDTSPNDQSIPPDL